jgi:hypothetical protein
LVINLEMRELENGLKIFRVTDSAYDESGALVVCDGCDGLVGL